MIRNGRGGAKSFSRDLSRAIGGWDHEHLYRHDQSKHSLRMNCVTQLKLYTFKKLSSTIFCCLSVSQASVSPDQISSFSNIYRHTSPLLTLYHLIPSSYSFNILTKYQKVSSYTVPVPSSTTPVR